MTGKWSLDIDCANCAAKLEDALSGVPGVEQVRIDFMRRTITLTAQDSDFEKVTQAVLARAKQVEPDAVIHTDACAAQHDRHPHDHHHDAGCGCAHQHGHHHGDGCSCGHDHSHEPHCACGHDHHDHHDHDHHDHDHGNSDHGRVLLYRVGAAAALLVLGLATSGWISTALFVLAYLAAGYDVLLGAGRNILRGKVFDENFLMSVASVGAMLMGDFAEGVAVMTLYQLGEYFQDKAVDKSRASIAGLMDIRPDYANLLQADGSARQVSPEAVEIGDTILVKPGERVPLDGQVVSGASTLDTMALTGESLPREVGPGDGVISGCVNESAVLTVRVTTRYGESTVAKILELVERSGQAKAKTERFITRFARVYTPLVCMAAVLLAVVPSLLDGQWMEWIRRALTFLVISCPCALVISVPLTFFSGIGAASRRGILIKGANHLEALAEVDTVVFDKTGTLTRGVFTVTGVYPEDGDEAALLETAALAECWSDHPISRSLQAAWGKEMDPARVTDAQEIAGHGVKAVVDGRVVHAGNSRLMAQLGLQTAACGESGTVVHMAQDNRYMGYIVLGDVLKPTAQQAVTALKAAGVKRLVMLTGDRRAAAEETARQLGLTDVHAELLPGDKVGKLESILKDAAGGRTAFCGDGINDAPVLRRADVGVAMGALGSDAAIEAADVVLMDDDPLKMAGAIRVARGTMRIAWQNIIFSLGVKLLVMLLGALGIANMWLAVFADVGVCMLAILNATRAGFGSGRSNE